MRICDNAIKHNLPNSMLVPIAAKDIDDIKLFVGNITQSISTKQGVINAIVVNPYINYNNHIKDVPLWKHANSSYFAKQLFPLEQIWVHVDYTNYRNAYKKLSKYPIPKDYILDHIKNRKAIRLRNYSHQFLRLCPISKKVNTNAGGLYGMEGMENTFLKSININSQKYQKLLIQKIEYADPMDITKMLNLSTGTQSLSGVAKMLLLYYNN